MADEYDDSNDCPATPTKASRRNWGFSETQVLLNAAIAKKEHLRGQYKSSDAVEKRDKAWQEIVKAVNTVSEVHRDRTACETRLRCFTHTIKKNVQSVAQDAKKTGGGPAANTQYDPELVNLALSWLDLSTVEGCPGAGESRLESEEEETVERERITQKEDGEAKREALQKKIEDSKAKLLADEPKVVPFFLKKRGRQPVPSTSATSNVINIPDTDDDSTTNTPRRCAIRKPRTTKAPESCDVTSIVQSIDNLSSVMVEVKAAISLAHRDILGLSRDVSYAEASVGSDVPFDQHVADVNLQVEVRDEHVEVSSKKKKALGILMKVLEDEIPKVGSETWKSIIGRGMSMKMKEIQPEERVFNIFMDEIGDGGQDEVMLFFNENSPEILKFSPPELSLKVMILIFDYMVEHGILAVPEKHSSVSKRASTTAEVPENPPEPKAAKTTTEMNPPIVPSTSKMPDVSTDGDDASSGTQPDTLCMEPLNTDKPSETKGKQPAKGKKAAAKPKNTRSKRLGLKK